MASNSDHLRLVSNRIDEVVESSRLKSGDGGGTFDGMEARVKRLEDDFAEIRTDLRAIRTDLSYVKGKLESAPSAQSFGELKGRVDGLPTTAKLASLLGIAVAAIAILNNWDKVSAALFGS